MFGIKKAIRKWLLTDDKPKKKKQTNTAKKTRKKRVVTAPGTNGYYKMILLVIDKNDKKEEKIIDWADCDSRKEAFGWAEGNLMRAQEWGFRLHNLSIGRVKDKDSNYCIAGSKYIYLATSDSWRKAV
mgnify:CR=1 FL=1|jgi:hypothetical protein